MKLKIYALAALLLLFNLTGRGQCRDTILEKFGTGLPTQGGTWAANSVIYGDSVRCPGLSCSYSPQYYIGFNGVDDFIRTPLIPYSAVFSFWYKRSNTSSIYHRAFVETSPDGVNWTTQITITTFTATYTKVSLNINNSYVRIRDARTLATDTKLWYIDDVAWSWDNGVAVWEGFISADWHNPLNWCNDRVPTPTDDVLVLPGGSYGCIIFSGVGTCRNITTIYPGSVTNYGTLKINGTISSNYSIYTRSGTVELNGSTPQIIKGSNLGVKRIGNLVISNPAGVSFGTNPTDTLKLLNSLTFTTANSTLTTGGALTLCSSDTLTARIGPLGSNRILGNVVVERYIPNHPKAWQFLSTPTTGQTIRQSWQENNAPLGNTRPGYGTIITGTAAGVDITSALPSMKTYNANTNLWDGIITTAAPINNPKGYMVFVRGDRSVTAINQAATATRLRTVGTLYTPVDNPPPIINVQADKFESIGNPYASAINFSKLIRTGGVQNSFYTWDPKLTTAGVSAYGLGGYQTFAWNGVGYSVIPGGGSYASGNTNIESGQAFFVRAIGSSGTITFTEDVKAEQNNLVTRAALAPSMTVRMSVLANSVPILIDGVLSQHGYRVGTSDVLKIGNEEGISIYRNNQRLAANFRNGIRSRDTIYYRVNRLRQQTYELEFIPDNLTGAGMLVDTYTGRRYPVSTFSATRIQFTATNDTLSSNAVRFYLVLQRTPLLQDTDILKAYPNPATSNEVVIAADTLSSGWYQIKLVNGFGRSLMSSYITHTGGSFKYTLHSQQLNLPGYYRVELVNKLTSRKLATTLIKN